MSRPAGDIWYARRFAWQPRRNATAPAPPPMALGPAQRAAASTAASARTEWPEGTADVVRCEIDWVSAHLSSRFEAIVYRPGTERGKAIGTSARFSWTLKEKPDGRDPNQLVAVKALRAALIADGWEEIGEGPAWYARRFVWRGSSPAPERVGGVSTS